MLPIPVPLFQYALKFVQPVALRQGASFLPPPAKSIGHTQPFAEQQVRIPQRIWTYLEPRSA